MHQDVNEDPIVEVQKLKQYVNTKIREYPDVPSSKHAVWFDVIRKEFSTRYRKLALKFHSDKCRDSSAHQHFLLLGTLKDRVDAMAECYKGRDVEELEELDFLEQFEHLLERVLHPYLMEMEKLKQLYRLRHQLKTRAARLDRYSAYKEVAIFPEHNFLGELCSTRFLQVVLCENDLCAQRIQLGLDSNDRLNLKVTATLQYTHVSEHVCYECVTTRYVGEEQVSDFLLGILSQLHAPISWIIDILEHPMLCDLIQRNMLCLLTHHLNRLPILSYVTNELKENPSCHLRQFLPEIESSESTWMNRDDIMADWRNLKNLQGPFAISELAPIQLIRSADDDSIEPDSPLFSFNFYNDSKFLTRLRNVITQLESAREGCLNNDEKKIYQLFVNELSQFKLVFEWTLEFFYPQSYMHGLERTIARIFAIYTPLFIQNSVSRPVHLLPIIANILQRAFSPEPTITQQMVGLFKVGRELILNKLTVSSPAPS